MIHPLTTSPEPIILVIRSGSQARCPVCNRLFVEALSGEAKVTCKDNQHRGREIKITFQSS